MWNCIKCNTIVEDGYTTCPHCGAPKSAGRFGNTAPVRPAAAYTMPAQNAPQSAPRPAPAEVAAQPLYMPDFSHVHAGRGLMFAGSLLAILLPLLVLLLAWRQYDAISSFLLPLFFADAAALSNWVRYPVYIVLALLAALVSALPGLWTQSLGKALRRLARMEELL